MKTNPAIFTQFLATFNVPAPVAEHRFHPIRKWRMDWAWPDYLVALEVNGGLFIGGRHTRGGGQLNDMIKFNHAAELGWRILQVQPKDLLKTETAQMIKRTIYYGTIYL